MKRIIRLTERDLTRIVRRVIKESTGEPIKVKLFSLIDKQMTKRDCNIEATNLKVSGSEIRFNYKIAGNGWCSLSQRKDDFEDLPTTGEARIFCGDYKRNIEFITEETKEDMMAILGFLSKEGYAKLSKKCDEYVSVDDDDTNNDFV